LLKDRGFSVDVACDGAVALDLLGQNDYAIAVLDYQMPGMDGVELFRRAREVRPDLKGVFLTAFPNINTVFPAIEAGVERVLAKPADVRELIPVMETLLRT
jgi:DNA-binding response OmpR family regulator